jgi:prepilin-type N-terminal cleavage/methylation domain-containing protein
MPRARRAGYTLFEVVIVVAIIATVAAIVLPSMSALFADSRVDASADMILARMADARSMAMEQSKPVRFGFMPGSGKFQIAPDDSDVWNTSSSSDGPIDKEDQLTGQLLKDVVFSTDPSSISGSGSSSSGNWQVGGIFMPNGTARGGLNPDGTTIDDVSFYFGMSGQAPRGVRVRGVIGTVRLFDPAADEGN